MLKMHNSYLKKLLVGVECNYFYIHSVYYECTRCFSGKNGVLVNQILEDEEKVVEINVLSATGMEENRQINKQKLFSTEGRMDAMPQGRNKGVASLIISISVQ